MPVESIDKETCIGCKRFIAEKMMIVMMAVLMIGLLAGCSQQTSAEEEQGKPPGEMAQQDGPPEGARAPGAPPAAGKKPGGFVHEQEFSVITVGTGCPVPSESRASACTTIQYKGNYYVLDTGNGSTTRFSSKGLPFNRIRAVIFTHLHLDHTSDYFDMVTNRWMAGGKEMDIIGPPRTGQLHEFATTFYKDDLNYRKLRGMTSGVKDVGMFTGVAVKEILGGDSFELDGMAVTTAEMTHTMYDIAYRFDADGKSIVVSGDTSFDPDLITLAKDADILVMDTSFAMELSDEKETAAFADDRIEKPEPAYEYAGNFEVQPHPLLPDVITIAKEANVNKLVFTHFPPIDFDEGEIRQLIVDGNYGYEGEMIFSVDGMEVTP